MIKSFWFVFRQHSFLQARRALDWGFSIELRYVGKHILIDRAQDTHADSWYCYTHSRLISHGHAHRTTLRESSRALLRSSRKGTKKTGAILDTTWTGRTVGRNAVIAQTVIIPVFSSGGDREMDVGKCTSNLWCCDLGRIDANRSHQMLIFERSRRDLQDHRMHSTLQT